MCSSRGLMKRTYHVIGACSCWGAQLRACEGGPEDLADGSVFDLIPHPKDPKNLFGVIL